MLWFPRAARESGLQLLRAASCSWASVYGPHSAASRIPAGTLQAPQKAALMSLGRASSSVYGS